MPQVAARISEEQEKWLKGYFRTKSAGAEFILPWAVDTFFRAINLIRSNFTAGELKVIVNAHKNFKLQPENTKLSYLLLRVCDACEKNNLHKTFGISRDTLEAKLKKIDDTQATALMIWASAFWVSKNCAADNLDEYIKTY